MAVSKEKEWFPERRRSGIGGQPAQMEDDLIEALSTVLCILYPTGQGLLRWGAIGQFPMRH